MTVSAQNSDHRPNPGAEPAKPGLVRRYRDRYEWFDHLARAGSRYQDSAGDNYAAAITYYTILALIPLIMVMFSAAGFVLFSRPDLLAQLFDRIRHLFPGELGSKVIEAVLAAISRRTVVGVLGLLGALYSGLGWMTNIRNALTAQWGQGKEDLPVVRTYLVDLACLIGLFLAMVVSLGITTLFGGSARGVLDFTGLTGVPGVGVLLRVLSILVSIGATWLVFVWVLSRLPRKPVTIRSAARGALFAAVGFEIFKQLGGFYFRSISSSPAGAAFGPLIGVFVLVYFVSRFLLFVAAWTATSRDNLRLLPVAAPEPVVIRPVVRVSHVPGPATTVGLLGVGALLGFVFRRRTRRP